MRQFHSPANPSTDASGEYYHHHRDTGQLDLLASDSVSTKQRRRRSASTTDRESHDGPSAELKARIQKLGKEMLEAAGAHGVGFDEVCQAAETRGWLTGKESGRFLSFGSLAMKAAGGVVSKYRRSRKPQSQRRRVAVYVLACYTETMTNG